MSRSISVDVVFGFTTTVELSYADIKSLRQVGITASPLLFTTEEKTNEYIVGKNVTSLGGAGEYHTFEFNPTDSEKAKIKADIYKGLDQCGFDVKDKECKLWINTYYA